MKNTVVMLLARAGVRTRGMDKLVCVGAWQQDARTDVHIAKIKGVQTRGHTEKNTNIKNMACKKQPLNTNTCFKKVWRYIAKIVVRAGG